MRNPIVAQVEPNCDTRTIADLQHLPHWVSFLEVPQPNGKKPRKVPYTPGTNREARVNDQSTWRSYADAVADAERTGRRPGVAITPEMNLTLVDIDGEDSHGLVAAIDSFTERSVNGGWHILAGGRPPQDFTVPAGVEVYPRIGHRFCVLTGNIADGRDQIVDRTDLLARLFPPRPEPVRRPVMVAETTIDDQEVIARVLRMPKGRQLHGGGDTSGYPSGSEADLGLLNCYIAAGATDPDYLDALYRQSALHPQRQERWDDARYRERTIGRALDGHVAPFDGWNRSKNGVVVGKPQDAGHPFDAESEPLAATETDGLPDDIPSLKQIIRDLTHRIETAEQRAQAAEARADMLSAVQRTGARIIRNKHLGQERFTAIALSHRFANLESTGTEGHGGLHPITIRSVAEVAGVSEDAASRHIGTLVEAGVLRKELRWIPRSVDPETGEIIDGHKRQFIGPAGGTVIDFVQAVATLQPAKAKTWGGRIDRCRPCSEHPDAGVVKRVTFHCAECDQVLGQLPDEPYDVPGPDPQDAGHQPGAVPNAGTDRGVVTPLVSRTARVSNNDAEGTTVAAAWLRGAPLPGMEPPPLDYRTDVAYGARR